jgi:uncharacterized protein YacL
MMRELTELGVLTIYLYAAFGGLLLFKVATLEGHGIDWAPWGLAAIKAVLVAKFILMGRALGVGERFKTRPLIWQTVHRSVVFLVVVLILTAIEGVIVGLIHGRAMRQSLAALEGGTPMQLMATLIVVFMIFLPYFAFTSLGEVMGDRTLFRLFFVKRDSWKRD